ncbi:hypothetical protein O203_11155 [Ectopseudomonas chengduensis]|nr:Rho termination factor N-terminal domain-containing protein [Pseudomonas chengduensis]ERH50892.1 hypothetical protein O203_11155 [Pseudomonas chengduensis]
MPRGSKDKYTAKQKRKAELMELARKRDIAGRSSMRKEELLQALRKASA